MDRSYRLWVPPQLEWERKPFPCNSGPSHVWSRFPCTWWTYVTLTHLHVNRNRKPNFQCRHGRQVPFAVQTWFAYGWRTRVQSQLLPLWCLNNAFQKGSHILFSPTSWMSVPFNGFRLRSLRGKSYGPGMRGLRFLLGMVRPWLKRCSKWYITLVW